MGSVMRTVGMWFLIFGIFFLVMGIVFGLTMGTVAVPILLTGSIVVNSIGLTLLHYGKKK